MSNYEDSYPLDNVFVTKISQFYLVFLLEHMVFDLPLGSMQRDVTGEELNYICRTELKTDQ